MSCCSLSCMLRVPARLVPTPSFPTSSSVVTWPPARMSSPSPLSCPGLVLVCDSAQMPSPPGLLFSFGKQWTLVMCPPQQGRCSAAPLPHSAPNCLFRCVSFYFPASHALSLQISRVWVKFFVVAVLARTRVQPTADSEGVPAA